MRFEKRKGEVWVQLEDDEPCAVLAALAVLHGALLKTEERDGRISAHDLACLTDAIEVHNRLAAVYGMRHRLRRIPVREPWDSDGTAAVVTH